MIELLVASTYASMPQLASTIARFAGMQRLTWLRGGASLPATYQPLYPAVDSLNDLPSSDRLVIVVAPNSEESPGLGQDRRVLRVLERSAGAGRELATALVIDDYSQIELLASLSDY